MDLGWKITVRPAIGLAVLGWLWAATNLNVRPVWADRIVREIGGAGITGQAWAMSKADRVVHLRVEGADGLDPHYAGWFACFNRGEYYEAHDVLEALWLRERGRDNDRFYKGLIQLAGAFVHLQKGRLKPSDALFRLAEANLREYGDRHERLDLVRVLGLITAWRTALAEGGFAVNPLGIREAPTIDPIERSGVGG